MMGVIATISIFISIASREKLVWESGPGLDLAVLVPRCLNPEVINGRIVIILTSSRSPESGAGNTFHFYMVTTHKEMG